MASASAFKFIPVDEDDADIRRPGRTGSPTLSSSSSSSRTQSSLTRRFWPGLGGCGGPGPGAWQVHGRTFGHRAPSSVSGCGCGGCCEPVGPAPAGAVAPAGVVIQVSFAAAAVVGSGLDGVVVGVSGVVVGVGSWASVSVVTSGGPGVTVVGLELSNAAVCCAGTRV